MKTKLLFFPVFATAVLSTGLASCANDDTEDASTQPIAVTDFIGASDAPASRTSMNVNTGNFSWTAGDHIFIKTGSTWRKSTNEITSAEPTVRFFMPGTFTENSYAVYYPGKNGEKNKVTIAAKQQQTTPNTTTHFGEAGDNGWGNATKEGGRYKFTLQHKAAYLKFVPYSSNEQLRNFKLIKVEVSSDKDLAGTYTINADGSGLTPTAPTKTITLETNQGQDSHGAYKNPFPIPATEDATKNGAYMVIAPGYHRLKVRFWLEGDIDVGTGTMEKTVGTISKVFDSFDYKAGEYTPISFDLAVTTYDKKYYQWDATKDYWDGKTQVTKNLTGNGTADFTPNDPRKANTTTVTLPFTYRNADFASLPNVNELLWYVKNGDPHWDGTELWICMDNVYKGGLWLKKKSKIDGFDAERYVGKINSSTSATTTQDYRDESAVTIDVTVPTKATPDVSEIDDYFFLPSLGYYYNNGALGDLGRNGYYWSSTGVKGSHTNSYYLHFEENKVEVKSYYRTSGYKAWNFNYFQ